MENEKNNSKATTIIIIILTIAVICLGGFILYDKILKSNNDSNQTNTNKTTETESISHKSGNLYKNANDKNIICSTSSNTPYVKGTEYNCNNLGDGKSYIFYVLNDATNSDKVDLIMNKDYAKASYINSGDYTESNNASLGPINAIKFLPTLNTWSNLESPKDNSGYDYSQYAARLPMAIELANACNITNFTITNDKDYELKNNNDCSFLWKNTQYIDSSYDYNGYYTSTSLGTYYHAWALFSTNMTKEEYDAHIGVTSEVQLYDTVLLSTTSAGQELGIRPVISLSK